MSKEPNLNHQVNEVEKHFSLLCQSYDLNPEWEHYNRLLGLFSLMRDGHLNVDEPYLSDSLLLETARMLKQLSYSKGKFSLTVGVMVEQYESSEIVERMRKLLEDILDKKVMKIIYERGEKVMGLCINETVEQMHPIGRRSYISYPEGCEMQEEGFSEKELDMIIHNQEKARYREKLWHGSKETWEEGNGQIPLLGKYAREIRDLLPSDWKKVKQHNFIANFLYDSGFLYFKSQTWKNSYLKKKPQEVDRMVRDWIKSFEGISNKVISNK